MGDIADQLTEEGFNEYLLHIRGRCGELSRCRYCEKEMDDYDEPYDDIADMTEMGKINEHPRR